MSVVSALVGAKVMERKYVNDSSKTINMNKGIFNNRLSMMLETDLNTGQYQATTSDNWQTSGYKFNSKLSKCESGGKVSWDYKNKRLKMEGSTSDKCYIYFDRIVIVDSYCEDGDNLADCIKTYGKISQVFIYIILHLQMEQVIILIDLQVQVMM